MPLMNVPGTRSGDSLPAELRSGVREWGGSPWMPSLRLSAGGAGLSGMSVWYGASEGPSGYRAYNWPPYGYRGISGLGQGQTCVDEVDSDGNPTGQQFCYGGETDNTYSGSGTVGSGIPCQSDDTAGLIAGQVYCDTGGPTPLNTMVNLAQQGTAQSANVQPPQTTPVSIGGSTVQAQHPPGYTGSLTCPAGYTCTPAPAGYQWTPVISATGQTIAQIMAVAQGGSYSISPSGASAVSGTAGAPAAGTAASTAAAGLLNLNNMMPILLLGGGVLLLVMMMQPGRK